MASRRVHRLAAAALSLLSSACAGFSVSQTACEGAGAYASPLVGLGCGASSVSVPVEPPSGFVITYQSAPLETNFEATPVGKKKGEAVVHYVFDPILTDLPLLTWGDASLEEAVADGGIQTVHFTDYQVLSVLGIYVQLTIRVTGD
jgi:hypothetical protein